MKIKYTARVKRGLGLMGAVCAMVLEENEPAALTQMKRWTRQQHDDFQQACRWVRQEITNDQRRENPSPLTPSEGVSSQSCSNGDEGSRTPESASELGQRGTPTSRT